MKVKGTKKKRTEIPPFLRLVDLEVPVSDGGCKLEELVKGQLAVLVVVELRDRDFGRELATTQGLEQGSELGQVDGAALVGVDLFELGLDVSNLFLGEVGLEEKMNGRWLGKKKKQEWVE